jgi:hypothetical protein
MKLKSNLVFNDGTTQTTAATAGSLPTGVVEAYAGSSAPSGWLLCSGQAVSRTTYSALFAIISTTFGSGDGSTTFNVPDMRGRIAAGLDNMGGSAASRITSGVSGITGTSLGAVGGDERVQTHTHTQNAHSHNRGVITTGGTPANPGVFLGSASATVWYTNSGSGYTADSGGTSSETPTNQNYGAGSSQNVQPTMMLNYIIKT